LRDWVANEYGNGGRNSFTFVYKKEVFDFSGYGFEKTEDLTDWETIMSITELFLLTIISS
jgi:hypothetical protein